jgi:hypothetical protein
MEVSRAELLGLRPRLLVMWITLRRRKANAVLTLAVVNAQLDGLPDFRSATVGQLTRRPGDLVAPTSMYCQTVRQRVRSIRSRVPD